MATMFAKGFSDPEHEVAVEELPVIGAMPTWLSGDARLALDGWRPSNARQLALDAFLPRPDQCYLDGDGERRGRRIQSRAHRTVGANACAANSIRSCGDGALYLGNCPRGPAS